MVALLFVTASCRCWLRPRFLETESNFDGIKVDLVSELTDKVLECIDTWMQEKIYKGVRSTTHRTVNGRTPATVEHLQHGNVSSMGM